MIGHIMIPMKPLFVLVQVIIVGERCGAHFTFEIIRRSVKLLKMSLKTFFVVVKFATMLAFQTFFRVKFVNSGDVFPESGHVSECFLASITVDVFAIVLMNQSVHSQSMSCCQRRT